MLVGEQPGDREDLRGPAVRGPGRDGCWTQRSSEAGIDRDDVYLTNVVKHFKWRAAGQAADPPQARPARVRACRPWLEAELAAVRPRSLVCLGATAAQALLGKDFRVTKERGKFVESPLAPLRDGDRASLVDPARARRHSRGRAHVVRPRPCDGGHGTRAAAVPTHVVVALR